MKIKIKPLKTIEELNLPIASEKFFQITDSSKNQEILSELFKEARKIPGAIVGIKNIEGQSSVMGSFKTKGGGLVNLPEPNPVLIYFKIAIDSIEEARSKKKDFSETPQDDMKNYYVTFNSYFEKACAGIIFLVSTAEAFSNQLIPEDYITEIDGKSLNKQDIEWKDLKAKIKIVLPNIKGVNFLETHPIDYNNILEIQSLRNDLIHLKTNLLENETSYQELFQRVHEIDLDKYTLSIKKFIDFFRNGLIETE